MAFWGLVTIMTMMVVDDAGDDDKGDYLEDNDKEEDAFSWFSGA